MNSSSPLTQAIFYNNPEGYPPIINSAKMPAATDQLIERYGLTADEVDRSSIAAAVTALLGDPARARQMGANAARAFDPEFRYDKQFAPVLTAMTGLTSERRP